MPSYVGKYFEALDKKKVRCNLCPRHCEISEGKRGLCFVRTNEDGKLILETYGRSSGFCIDPIEKKPLNHFYPGSSILSFGTAGCNLTCKFCQNWDISKARDFDRLTQKASPEEIAKMAQSKNSSVAFTYNEPIIFSEYAIDTAIACRDLGVKTVAVTAGYINEKPREDFFSKIDAVNVDLKAFTNSFYKTLCGAELQPVLDTLKYIKSETNVWLEVTTLLIPGENDGEGEINEMMDWALENLGPDVPWHFSAFRPAFKYTDSHSTPASTIQRAREIGLKKGMNYVFTGNIVDPVGASTYCPKCKKKLIGRSFYQISDYNIKDGKCTFCSEKIKGHFSDAPGSWGNKRSGLTF